jgi:hypothetical protein
MEFQRLYHNSPKRNNTNKQNVLCFELADSSEWLIGGSIPRLHGELQLREIV